MNRIFCLETEWVQTIHDLKRKSTVLSLLELVNSTFGEDIPFVFRQVASLSDFNYYLDHLMAPSYDAYDTIYLCFHGTEGEIHFADKLSDQPSYRLLELATDYQGVFKGRNIIFGSCWTLKAKEEDLVLFKKTTGARIVIGYSKSVKSDDSFIFEYWLLCALAKHPDYGAKRLLALAEEEMPFLVKKLGLICY